MSAGLLAEDKSTGMFLLFNIFLLKILFTTDIQAILGFKTRRPTYFFGEGVI